MSSKESVTDVLVIFTISPLENVELFVVDCFIFSQLSVYLFIANTKQFSPEYRTTKRAAIWLPFCFIITYAPFGASIYLVPSLFATTQSSIRVFAPTCIKLYQVCHLLSRLNFQHYIADNRQLADCCPFKCRLNTLIFRRRFKYAK